MKRIQVKEAVFAGCLATWILIGYIYVQTAPVMPVVVEPTPQLEPAILKDLQATQDSQRTITVEIDGEVVTMDWESYLVGVVLAEMPASFESEALKAQSVAARTFLAKSLTQSKHSACNLCGKSSCCQAYDTPAVSAQKLGEQYEAYREKVAEAVTATDGQVLTYDGALIDAVYFSCSGGTTEDAVAVWGQEVAYLQSVESQGEEGSTPYSAQVSVPISIFVATLQKENQKADFTVDPTQWLGAVTHSEGGGVLQMEIGGQLFQGTDLRSWFGLNSTNFTVAITDQTVTFQTLGYGHRVGMSQYGAQAMAIDGSTYDQILYHYYTDVQLSQITP